MNTATNRRRIAIFITLSNRAVFRNLFFFPKSLFEKLKDFVAHRPEYLLVVLGTSKDHGKYDDKLGAGRGETYVIETIATPSPKESFLKKLFFFWYSHLIYTDTTRLMATLGMRPDEPPAGGNRFLFPVKWLVAHTFGNCRAVKRRLVPFLFHHLYQERPFSALFLRYRPRFVFASHLYGWFDQLLIAEARRRGVKTGGMVAGWDQLDKYYFPFHVDRLFVQSDELAAAALRYQAYDAGDLVRTGYPHTDFILDRSFAAPRAAVLVDLGFPKGAKYILYASGSVYCPDEPEIIETILQWMSDGTLGADVYLVLRPYLGGRSKDREFDEAKYRRFAEHPLVRFYDKDFWGNLPEAIRFLNILRHADVMVAIFTTMALEAIMLDRPVVAVGFDGYRTRPFHRSIQRFELFEHFQHLRETGAMPTARSFDELLRLFKETLANPRALGRERALVRATLGGNPDGRVSERVIDAITREL